MRRDDLLKIEKKKDIGGVGVDVEKVKAIDEQSGLWKYLSEHLETLEINVFTLSPLDTPLLLPCLFTLIFHKEHYHQHLQVTLSTLTSFAHKINSCYFNNPYHNSTHAADVAQFIYMLLKRQQADTVHRQHQGKRNILSISALEQVNLLVAGFIHDLEHPGVTNNFLVQIRSQLALTYNDKSPLENHHISMAFQIIQDPIYNIYASLTSTQFQHTRQQLIRFVLSTDNMYHVNNLHLFQNMLQKY